MKKKSLDAVFSITMESLSDPDDKKPADNLLFRPVNKMEDLSLQSSPQYLEEDDDDAWMREDAISLEDVDEEKSEALPFGLNQSWPRTSRPSHRRDTYPRLHSKKKLLRQISQESLDESTSLLLGHIVMLPEAPKDLVVEPPLPEFVQHPLLEEENEELHVEIEENVTLSEEINNPDVQLEEKNSFLASDAQVLVDQVSGAQKEKKVVLPDLESIEKDSFDSRDNQQKITTDPMQSDVGQDRVADNHEEPTTGKLREATRDDEVEEPQTNDDVNWALQNVGLHFDLQVKLCEGESRTKRETETGTHMLSDLELHASQADTKDQVERDLPKSFLSAQEQDTKIEVLPETSLGALGSREMQLEPDVVSPERSVRKKSSPGGRKRPPLLRYLSQESIEESTNLLMDHVVMMDFPQMQDHTSPGGTEPRCPFLVDIEESPLLDEDTIRTAQDEEDMFLYKGEVDSCDEDDDDDDEIHEHDGEEAVKDDPIDTIADMSSKSFISAEAASTLKDIELIRVELDDAIHAFEILKEEFPERTEGSHLPVADDIVFEDIDEGIDENVGTEDLGAFGVLPDEILIHMFKHFSHAELCNPIMLVCKKWNTLAKDPLLWQHLDLSNKAGIPMDILATVFRRCSLLRGINFRGRDEVSTQEIQAIVDHCPNVPSLEFGFVRTMQDDQFSLLISGCRSLTSLNMEGCDGITDSLISKLILLPKLRCLNLSHCTKLTDGAVFEIARFCDHLEELDINGIPWITDTAVTMLCDERQAKLRCLKLDGAELTDASIRHVVQCPNLEELNISFCEQLTDHSLRTLKEWKKPVRFRLQKGKEFSEEALANLFISPQMSNLTYLDLSECSELRDPGLINIATRCPLLTHLAIEWCWFISDVGLVQVLDNCRYLEHLDLIGLHSILGHCLADIPTKLPKLEFLDLRQCNRITDAMLVQIVSMKHNLVIMNYYGEEVAYGSIPGTLDIGD